MPLAELRLPVRVLAGGGPSSPDPRVLRAMTTALVGQFDPEFTAIMDDVVQLARRTFVTSNPNCFAISAQASGGLEAVLNSLLEPDSQRVAVGGSAAFVASTADLIRRGGGEPVSTDQVDAGITLMVVPLIDPVTSTLASVQELAAACHARN